jgi:hypothetical protein
MNKYKCIFIVVLFYVLGCNPTNPMLIQRLNIDSNQEFLVWDKWPRAINYELERQNPDSSWVLIYSGSETRYDLGRFKLNAPIIFYRVRPIFKTSVGQWLYNFPPPNQQLPEGVLRTS